MGRAAPALTCPFCESGEVELVSPWGGQMITSQMRCRACNTYFEAIRPEFEAADAWTTSSADDR
jgi:C4-type Zn-finger protein